VYQYNKILVSPKPFWQHGCAMPLTAHNALLLLDMADLSNFINPTTPGGCRQLSLLTHCAVSLHNIQYLLLKIFMVFQIFGLLVSKPSLLRITANKPSETNSRLHVNV
jgi:hypothetical protein